jgi:hypothetical protein
MMTTEWAVVPGGDQFTLDARNSGLMTFTVSNPGAAADTVVFDIIPGDGSLRSWFSVDEPLRVVGPHESVAFHVTLIVPAGTPSRRYDMTGLAYSANTAPEESSRTSGRVSYEVAILDKPKRKIPWLLIAIATAVVLVVAGVIVFVTRSGGSKVPAPVKPVAAKVNDFTGDGKADVALTGVVGWGTIPLAISQGNGRFTVKNEPNVDFAKLASTAGAKAVQGDFNGDGKEDIALAGAPGWSGVPIAFSKGDGTFTVVNKPLLDFPGWATAAPRMLAGDFNGDGRDDLLLTGGPGWTTMPVAFSQGDGTFTTTNKNIPDVNSWTSNAALKAVVGDADGDGRADLIMTGISGWGTIPVAFSKGDGTFQVTNFSNTPIPFYAAMPNTQMIAGDVDGDGKADLIIAGGATWQVVLITYSVGDGTFKFLPIPQALPNAPQWAAQPGVHLVAGDFNGDGKADFALAGGPSWTSVPVGFANGAASLFDVKNEPIDLFGPWASSAGVKAF